MSRARTALAAAALLLLAGCSSPAVAPTRDKPHAADSPVVPSPTHPAFYNEADVYNHLRRIGWHVNAQSGDLTYRHHWHCYVSVVLTSANAVDLYASAGDDVVTNPPGDAGFKIGGPNERTCRTLLTASLSGLLRPPHDRPAP